MFNTNRYIFFMLLLNCGALLLLRHRFLSAQSNLYNGSLRCNNNHAKWQNMQDKIILYWKNKNVRKRY